MEYTFKNVVFNANVFGNAALVGLIVNQLVECIGYGTQRPTIHT